MKENLIEKILCEHIKEKKSVFVFPTQTAADLWADRIICVSNVTAVAMKRFCAWDDFKGSSIKSQHQDKTSVPSVMRKIFASQIVEENKIKPFFKNIIVPEYAQNAAGFTNYISSLLPSLSLWKKYFEQSKCICDDEDKDLLELYERYSKFLEKHNLFDPAWETPPFNSDGNHYYIFFPEILSDYTEYKNILEQSPEDITIIHLPQSSLKENGTVNFFSNSRTEIRYVSLYLRKLHEEKNISWSDMAVSIPDMENYGPYVERDFSIYEIPFVMRYAKPLATTGAGSLFEQMKSCVSSDFSFESIKTLFLNTELPWNDEEKKSNLIKFGQENNCICSYEYKGEKVDVWNKSYRGSKDKEVLDYYRKLNHSLKAIVNAESFKEIREKYFAFRSAFFEMSKCSPKSDKILSRCISELGALIDLEEEFPECKILLPFSFFVNELTQTNYLEQTNERGVQLLPYKLASCAPFAVHVILDSSQASLAVVYKQFNFLREDKRERLIGKGKKVEDPNVTEQFINLYNMNSIEEPVFFSAASKTFSGYGQANSYLTEKDFSKKKDEPRELNEDSYVLEKKWLSSEEKESFPELISAVAKLGFEVWKKCYDGVCPSREEQMFTQVKERLTQKRYADGKLSISPTHLRKFFECPRKWLLKYIIGIEEQNNEAELMDVYAIGNLNHKIMQLFCQTLMDSNLLLKAEENVLDEGYRKILLESIDKAIIEERNSFLAKELLQTTKQALVEKISATAGCFSQTYSGYEIIAVEKELEYEIPEKNILCVGKIDCLLRNPADGNIVLVDFKTSGGAIPKTLVWKEPAENEEEKLPDFQMPMYVYLLKNLTIPVEVNECCFYNMKDCCPTAIELTDFDVTINKMLECVEVYSDTVTKTDFTTTASSEFEVCNSCSYRAVCRKTFTVGKFD